jgi:hypothetical protein
MMEYRSWMSEMLDECRRLNPEYVDGVYDFVNRAVQTTQCLLDGGIRCPCVRCVSETY